MTAVILLVAALALLVVPGAAICLATGLPWRDAVAVGPALTLAVVAVGCTVTAATDVAWAPASAGVTALVALLCAGMVGIAVRVAAGRARSRGGNEYDDDDAVTRSPRRWVGDLVVVVLAALPAVQFGIATRGLTAIPQYWDALFHGGATRYIAETGQAGLTDLAPVSQPANPHFYYPDTYHALTSLLLHLPGDGTPGALNGMPGALNAMSAVTGVVFVLGVALLAGRLCGGSRLAAVGAAVVAASCWTFPFQVVGWGPLLPFALGVAVIPGLLVLGERLSVVRPGMTWIGTAAAALLLGAGMTGAWSVHPSVALAAAIPVGAQAVAGVVAAPGVPSRLTVVGGFALATLPVGAYAAWTLSVLSADAAGGASGFSWPRQMGVARAVAGVFDLGPSAAASAGTTLLVLIGLVGAVAHPRWRRPLAAVVTALVVYGVLYVLAAGVEGDWVRAFTGFWWDDMYRFAALLAVPSAVLAGAGVRALIPRGPARRPAARVGCVIATVCLLAALSGQALLVREVRIWGYGDGPAVTASERVVLDRLGELYDGGVMLGDPFDGTAWAYALHGVPVVFGTPLADDPVAQVGGDRMTLYTSINRYGFDPSITYEVQRQDVRWVVVGTGVVGGPGRPGGFIGLHLNPHLRLAAENEGARLYEVLPVPADHPPSLPPPGIPPVTPPEQPPNTDSPVVDAIPAGSGTNLGGTG
ncbi:DUF6541 family protein [Dietzia sp. NPDC055877]